MGSAASSGLHKAVALEAVVRLTDGVHMNAKLLGELAHRRERIVGRQFAAGDQPGDLLPQLGEVGQVRLGVDVYW